MPAVGTMLREMHSASLFGYLVGKMKEARRKDPEEFAQKKQMIYCVFVCFCAFYYVFWDETFPLGGSETPLREGISREVGNGRPTDHRR